jgi:hypothetical protein
VTIIEEDRTESKTTEVQKEEANGAILQELINRYITVGRLPELFSVTVNGIITAKQEFFVHRREGRNHNHRDYLC